MSCCWQLIHWASLALLLHQCFNGQYCLGCLEQERAALLQFKQHFINQTGFLDDPAAALASWVDHEEEDGNYINGGGASNDCCRWERVQCSPTTGRVIRLFLNSSFGSSGGGELMGGDDIICRFNWLLNATVFLPLEELQLLDLSDNCINGWLENEGFERLSSLKKMQTLQLNGNNFNNSVLTSLSALSFLTELYLQKNNLDGGLLLSQGLQRLAKLKNLEDLYLDYNHLDAGILSSLASFTSLKILSLQGIDLSRTSPPSEGDEVFSGFRSKLEVLELSWSNFSQSMLPSLGTFTSLKKLSLRGNYLNGSFPEVLCKLKNLQELDLNTNYFEGILPACLGTLTSLKILDLSNNKFRGNISMSPIIGLTSLECISLGYNNFDPTFPLISLANHSKLVEIYLDNYSNLEIKTSYNWFLPMFQLKILTLSYCNFNHQPSILALQFLKTQYDLRIARITHTNLSGDFPTWLIENNTKLEVLDFRNNSLTGYFHLPRYPHINLHILVISSNHIHGDLQPNLGDILPNLEVLDASTNHFGGKIPSTIGVMRPLHHLDLSSNNFSGEVPDSLAIGCTRLVILNLSNNSLSGHIFPDHEDGDHFNLTQLVSLRLNNNNFTGSIPIGVFRSSSNLQVFNVGKNQLSGAIPANWISNLTGLRTLVLRENSLEGPISHEFCGLSNVEFLDLSENYLTGSFPSCRNLSSLQFIHLQRNRFQGPIPNAFLHSKSLVTMNMGYNSFSGSIPSWIGHELVNLKVLILKANHLSGLIPYELCQMNQIGIMDLSYNNLYGSIPPCFRNIMFGKIGAIKYTFKPKNFFKFGIPSHFPHLNLLNGGRPFTVHSEDGEQEEVEFISKSISNSYKGSILNFMSGLDLSCNSLTGEIPSELGDLAQIHALNFSYNHLSGRIPRKLSNLKQLESLDLSHNNLSGEIPMELVELNFLAVFSVAYNNLSGRTPDQKAQFGTFSESSYEGNPFLCGPPLTITKNCGSRLDDHNGNSRINKYSKGLEDRYGINPVTFFVSFATSYVMCLLGFLTVFYMKPHWRRMWFHFMFGFLTA